MHILCNAEKEFTQTRMNYLSILETPGRRYANLQSCSAEAKNVKIFKKTTNISIVDATIFIRATGEMT